MSIYNPLINAINAKDIDKVMGLYLSLIHI